jgi:hypothetical protein
MFPFLSLVSAPQLSFQTVSKEISCLAEMSWEPAVSIYLQMEAMLNMKCCMPGPQWAAAIWHPLIAQAIDTSDRFTQVHTSTALWKELE